MSLFYFPQPIIEGQTIQLDETEARHAAGVLRSKIGDQITVTNGLGTMAKASIVSNSNKNFSLLIDSADHNYRPISYKLHVAVAPTKNIDRYEWFLEKSTEIGISKITPLLASHSERKIVKHDRSEKILISAMKQSQKAFLPTLDELMSIKSFLQGVEKSSAQKFIAHCDDEATKIELYHALEPSKEYIILIGPEGDFSPEEVDLAHKCGFKSVALGPERLRTETAALYATIVAATKNLI